MNNLLSATSCTRGDTVLALSVRPSLDTVYTCCNNSHHAWKQCRVTCSLTCVLLAELCAELSRREQCTQHREHFTRGLERHSAVQLVFVYK